MDWDRVVLLKIDPSFGLMIQDKMSSGVWLCDPASSAIRSLLSVMLSWL